MPSFVCPVEPSFHDGCFFVIDMIEVVIQTRIKNYVLLQLGAVYSGFVQTSVKIFTKQRVVKNSSDYIFNFFISEFLISGKFTQALHMLQNNRTCKKILQKMHDCAVVNLRQEIDTVDAQ